MTASMFLDAFWVLTTRFVMRAANLVVFMLLARSLDPESFGWYGYVMASALMLSVIFDAGLRQSGGLHLGRTDEDADRRRILANILALWLVLGLAGSGAMALDMRWGGMADATDLLLAAATLAPTLLVRMGQGTFLGLGRMRELNQSELASRAFLLVGTALAWAFGVLTIEVAVALLFLSFAGAACLLLWMVRDLLSMPRIDLDVMRELLATGLAFAGGIIAMILLGRIGIWIVNAMLGTAEVGAYFAVMRLSEMIAEVATAVGVVIFSHGVRNTDRDAAALATVRTARCVTAVMACVGVLAILFAGPIIRLTVGAAYVEAAGAFRILVVGSVLSCFAMTLYPGLSSHGGAKYGLRVFGPGTLLAGGLCWWLAPIWGLMGAAIAMSVAQGLVGLVMIVIYRRNFGIGLLQIIFPQGEDFSTLWNFLSSKFRRRSAIHPEAA